MAPLRFKVPKSHEITDEEIAQYMKSLKYDEAGHMLCPRCEKAYPTGTGGPKNILKTHMYTPNCNKAAKELKEQEGVQKAALGFKSFFSLGKKKKTVPSTATPPLIITTPASRSTTARPVQKPANIETNPIATSSSHPAALQSPNKTHLSGARKKLHEIALQLMDPPAGTENTFLAEFEVPPLHYDNPAKSIDELWEESINSMLHGAFGWGQDDETYQQKVIGLTAARLRGFSAFVTHFVDERGLAEGLLEARVTRLVEAIEKWRSLARVDQPVAAIDLIYPDDVPPENPFLQAGHPQAIEIDDAHEADIIDVDGTNEAADPLRNKHRISQCSPCAGYHLVIPHNKSPNAMYPFLLHDQMDLPWNVSIQNGKMFLHARLCDKSVKQEGDGCRKCCALAQNNVLKGIVERMENGSKEGTKYSYLGIEEHQALLRIKARQVEYHRLRALNQARKLAGKAAALDVHKRFLTAVASKKIERVDRIIRTGLRHGRGIRSMLSQCMKAAVGLYKPKSYEEEDYMRGLVLWKLGGNRIAGIAHRALNLPSITTLKNQVRIPPIYVSPRQPTAQEVSKNTEMSFTDMEEIMKPPAGARCNHAVLMFDEIATEKRLRYDGNSDLAVGVCREHAHKIPLEIKTEKDIEEAFHGSADSVKVVRYKANLNEMSGDRSRQKKGR